MDSGWLKDSKASYITSRHDETNIHNTQISLQQLQQSGALNLFNLFCFRMFFSPQANKHQMDDGAPQM